jgi:hypothetical protein
MDPAVALAHKLAAWNERRLIRDLYDAYFFVARVGVKPDRATLEDRLSSIRSRRPELKQIKTMTIGVFRDVLSKALTELNDSDVDEELGGLIPVEARAGLSVQIRAALNEVLASFA